MSAERDKVSIRCIVSNVRLLKPCPDSMLPQFTSSSCISMPRWPMPKRVENQFEHRKVLSSGRIIEKVAIEEW